MKTIYYVGDIGREGSAKFVHAQGIAKLFERINCHVEFICEGWHVNELEKTIEGFKFRYTRQYITKTKLRSAENALEMICGMKLWSLLKKSVKEKKPDIIVFLGNVCERKLIDFCKKRGIKLLVERVDWFEAEDCTYWFEKIIRRKAEQNITRNDFAADGIIAISGYFYNHFSGGGANVIQIPPVFDSKLSNRPALKSEFMPLRLVYAGSLGGGKDLLEPAIRAVMRLNQERVMFNFDIIGAEEKEIDAVIKTSVWNQFGIAAHGKLPHNKALEMIRAADFSFLLRENKRYAKAGFSTKFAESMFQGVPVICTRVGGADCCITDFYDGILLEDNAVETLLEVLRRLAAMSGEEVMNMKLNAFNTAQGLFAAEAYAASLDKFIREL